MKSLIEEASSVSKAVEKAWERAGRPISFSVKVFELPEKNFIGMTTKYAKVGIFFEDKKISEPVHKNAGEKAESIQRQRIDKKNVKQQSQETHEATNKIEKQKIKPVQTIHETNRLINHVPFDTSRPQEQETIEINVTWNDQMKEHLQEWLKKVLILIDHPHVEFTYQEQKNLLKVNFDSPLIGNELKESLLYKNLSYLGMVSLRTHFKNEMKNLKILLSRE